MGAVLAAWQQTNTPNVTHPWLSLNTLRTHPWLSTHPSEHPENTPMASSPPFSMVPHACLGTGTFLWYGTMSWDGNSCLGTGAFPWDGTMSWDRNFSLGMGHI